MRQQHRIGIGFALAIGLSGFATVAAQQGQAPPRLPGTISVRGPGQTVTGAYEGWFKNPDGSFGLVVGYYNRNEKEELDIPIGGENRIEPGGPDRGQPTHFGPGRQYGIFTVTVPKDFGTQKLTWTLVSHGQTNAVTMHLDPNWILSPFRDPGNGNKAPVLKFDPAGAASNGPPQGLAASLKARQRTLLDELDELAGRHGLHLTAPVTVLLDVPGSAAMAGVRANLPSALGGEPGGFAGRGNRTPANSEYVSPQQLSVTWSRYRGVGNVAFANVRPQIARADGKATTTATFAAPGEYMLRAQANDSTGEGGGGFQCCWTNAHVKVTVVP